MSLNERQGRFGRLLDTNPAWSLLRARNAPLILGFLTELFEKRSEVPIGEARASLDAHLTLWRRNDEQEPVSAQSYIRQWIADGYLREHDQQIMMTDAAAIALRFASSLQQREITTTASHLRIVQDAVENLILRLSPDIEERARILTDRINALQTELQSLDESPREPLSEAQEREQIREVYYLAEQLTGDFRLLEDQMRQSARDIRQAMIESKEGRGAVIEAALDAEDRLADTPAGQAFDGFYALLKDENRRREFRGQIQRLLELPAARHLRESQVHFLYNLVRELMNESGRVLARRKRASESLEAYVESGAYKDRRLIDRLVDEAKRAALPLKDFEGLSLWIRLSMAIDTGRVSVYSPDALALQQRNEALFDDEIVEHDPEQGVTEELFGHLYSVDLFDVAKRWRDAAQAQQGPATIAQIAMHEPIKQGLEEIVGVLRVAKALDATTLDGVEQVYFSDREGRLARAQVPRILIDPTSFPASLEDLDI